MLFHDAATLAVQWATEHRLAIFRVQDDEVRDDQEEAEEDRLHKLARDLVNAALATARAQKQLGERAVMRAKVSARAVEQIIDEHERLEAENERLKAENERLLEGQCGDGQRHAQHGEGGEK